MSEVLSGAEPRAARFTIVPADERQALRLSRFLMAAGTSVIICVALVVFAFLGLVSWHAAIAGTVAIQCVALLFYVLFRTGLNLRFADPSLTSQQIAAAIACLAYVMYLAGPARTAFTLLYLIAMLFGVLRLNARRLLVLAVFALGVHAGLLYLVYLRDSRMDVRAAAIEFGVLAIVLPWFAVMGGFVSRLRVRLSDSHRELKRTLEQLGEVAVRDDLTGTYNRRFLMETLAREHSRAERLSEPFAVCLVDVDHFKTINDTFGHGTGDEVLKALAQVAPRSLRSIDTFGRFGGEEFLIVLPGTDHAGAHACAERMRAAVAATAFPALPLEVRVTVTAGVAACHKGEDVSRLLARADEALYQGKHGGRDRVVALE